MVRIGAAVVVALIVVALVGWRMTNAQSLPVNQFAFYFTWGMSIEAKLKADSPPQTTGRWGKCLVVEGETAWVGGSSAALVKLSGYFHEGKLVWVAVHSEPVNAGFLGGRLDMLRNQTGWSEVRTLSPFSWSFERGEIQVDINVEKYERENDRVVFFESWAGKGVSVFSLCRN